MRISFAYIYLILILVQCRWDGKLKFKADGTFKILQLTDMHFGEDQFLDVRTMGVQYKLIKDTKPDLVVLSGDMFSGFADQCHGPNPTPECYKKGWTQYTYALHQLQQKYAVILGNHDAEADLNREEIMLLDQQSPYSLSQSSPEGVSPGSNYYLPIYDQSGTSIQSLIWMFDSHEETCEGQPSPWGCVESDQINWFNRKYQEILKEEKKDHIQSIGFVHIPPYEFVEAVNNFEISGNYREGVCCPCQRTDLVDALMQNDVLASFSGHDHNNDFSAIYKKNNKTIELAYGRKTGYGCYGPPADMLKGGQVITIKNSGDGKITYNTWLYNELGHKIERAPYAKSATKQKSCPC